MGKLRWAVVLATILLLPCIAFAVPQLINYQGKLSDGSGSPINGDYSITFIIYNASTGGDVLWAETQTVTVTDGVFSVLLGSQNPIPATTFGGDESYLGVKVGADPEMTPRQQLASVPYAISAENALIAETCTTPSCVPGDSVTCYTGDPATRGIGECTTGIRTCGLDGSFGACVGEVTPVTEVCNDGLDRDCDGQTYDGCPIHYIFATSGSYQGDLGGLSGADAICQSHGDSGSFTAGLGATWTAVLSDSSTNARDRLLTLYPVYNTHGDLVANNTLSDLWEGPLANPVGYDQNRALVTGNVWTGSDYFGYDIGFNCTDWSDTSGAGIYGRADFANASWIFDSTVDCGYDYNRLYCISSGVAQ